MIYLIYIGPFRQCTSAGDRLGELPALGICPPDQEPGVKFLVRLED